MFFTGKYLVDAKGKRHEYGSTYDVRCVIGRYTPSLNNAMHIRRSRKDATREGKCIECRKRTREDGMSHCGTCLDLHRVRNQRIRSRQK
jgi:hypothetical protein